MTYVANTKIVPLRLIKEYGKYIYEALTGIFEGHNQLDNLIQNLSTPPAPPGALNITNDGNGHISAEITDGQAIKGPISYFLEYDTDPNFTRPVPVFLGPVRNTQGGIYVGNANLYFRAYSSYLWSGSSKPIVFGGTGAPTMVNAGGAAPPAMVSMGSGVGRGAGQYAGTDGGTGYGPSLRILAGKGVAQS